jgi:hypothetical protein
LDLKNRGNYLGWLKTRICVNVPELQYFPVFNIEKLNECEQYCNIKIDRLCIEIDQRRLKRLLKKQLLITVKGRVKTINLTLEERFKS